jgi:hypothetical protein
MKTNYAIGAAVFLTAVLSASAADFYTQNFDSMGTNGTAPPSGWSVLYLAGDSLSSTIPTSSDMAGATAGSTTLQVWNQTEGAMDWGSGIAANEGSSPTDPNRLLGTSPTGDRGDMLQLSLNNTSGSTVTRVSVQYSMQLMAPGVLKTGFDPGYPEELPGYSFYYLDGSTWTHDSALDLTPPTPSSPQTTNGTAFAIINLTTPVAPGGTLQFRWYDDNADGYSPDYMFAIDNVTIDIPEPATLSLLAAGALALILRRSKPDRLVP